MSKAFTSEENEDDDYVEPPSLPPGVKNYITPAGAQRLRDEIEKLEKERRPLSNGNVDAQNRLRKIERRLRLLLPRAEAFVVIDPLTQPQDRVLFGASVAVRDAAGALNTWRIVGLDETDLDKGWISWMSPLANALLDKRVNETVALNAQRLTIQGITYVA